MYVCRNPSFNPCKPAKHSGQTALAVFNFDRVCLNLQVFQIYSKRSAEDIYKVLASYKANYLIIEDSICNEVGPVRGCRVKDLLDIANGHVSKTWIFPPEYWL